MKLIAALCFLALAPLARAAPPAVQYRPGQGSLTVVHVPPQPSGTPVAVAPGNAAAPAPAPSSPSSGDDAVDELTRLRAEQQKAWETINGNNPLSAGFGQGSGGVGAGTGPFEQINKILSQPAVQGYLKFFTNPAFSKGVDQIMNSPQRMTLLYVEIGFAVFMLIFRAWRFSKSAGWAGRLWTKVWTFAFYWVGSLIVVPWAVLGDPYYQTIRGALEVFMTAKK
jgi:hypothetical protein